MSEMESVPTEPWQFEALDCAVSGAEASAQATVAIWQSLSRRERDRWIAARADVWPRVSVFLQPILDAAAHIIQEEHACEDRERAQG